MDVINIILHKVLYIWFQLHFMRSGVCVCVCVCMYVFTYIHILLGGSVVKNLPAIQDTQVQSLGQGDPLEEDMATHSSILAWRIPWTGEPCCKKSDMTEVT